MRVFKLLGLERQENATETEKIIDKAINGQNLQSTSCIKAIGGFLRNHKKKINEDDLSNPIKTYQTTFAFLKYDIERYRD